MGKIKVITLIITLTVSSFSCNNKNIGKETDKGNSIDNNFAQLFFQENVNKVEMIRPIEYYMNAIIACQDNYYGFEDVSMEITQYMNISSIEKVDDFVPNLLTFLVSWFNQKGYVYYLYIFNYDQSIMGHYYIGQYVPFQNHRILMNKLSGNVLEYGNIAIGDYNDDGINEIVLYSEYKNIGNVFIVYGFNFIENIFEELCLVPVYINYYDPFPSVEYIGNGFRILEIIDDEFTELEWNKYIRDDEIRKYIRK
jgi:hypothetical protein